MSCPPGNYQARICALEEAWKQVSEGSGHPPLSASEGAAFLFDPVTQTLVIKKHEDIISVDTVLVPDGNARLQTTPGNNHQILIQQADEGGAGPWSLWVASGTIPGAWTRRTGSMSVQNSNAVNITGGSISGISPPIAIFSGGTGGSTAPQARTNLTLPTLLPAAEGSGIGRIDWSLSDNWEHSVPQSMTYVFSNVKQGKVIYFAFTNTSGGGAITLTFPDPLIRWPGNLQPALSDKTDLYIFRAVGGNIYAQVIPDFTLPV